MNDCAQRCLGGAALRQAFQNALDVAHPVCFIDVLHSGERFVVGNGGLNRRKLHKASPESVERNFVIGGKHSCQSRPMSRSEEHTSELQSRSDLVCRLLLEKKKHNKRRTMTFS